jgi:NMD protein affecting ribosome stability and mRNA decay
MSSQIDFSCQKCGKPTDIAPDPPERAVCEDCCEDHEYIYSRGDRTHYCSHCGQNPPPDWYDDIELDWRSR